MRVCVSDIVNGLSIGNHGYCIVTDKDGDKAGILDRLGRRVAITLSRIVGHKRRATLARGMGASCFRGCAA